jgi:hypothetical protein
MPARRRTARTPDARIGEIGTMMATRGSSIVVAGHCYDRGEIFGDEVTAAAMIDRLVHHAEILALKGDSYRLKDRDLARAPAEN